MSLILHGGITVNYSHLRNLIEDSTTISATPSSDTNIFFELNSIALAKFNNSLSAGAIDMEDIIDSWKIYRRKITDNQDTLVCQTSDGSIDNVRDYNVSNNNTYIYTLYPVTQNYQGNAIYTSQVTTDFWHYSITDCVTKEVYLLYLNLSSGQVSQNEDVNIIITNNQYPITMRGRPLYKSGQITCLLGNINSYSQYINDTVDSKEAFINCITNGNNKLLKNYKGDLLLVQTYGFTYGYEDNISEQPTNITFSWHESDSETSLSVYEEL